MAIAIDTRAAIQELEAAGIKPEHAEAIVKTVSRADDALVTKADLKAGLAEVRGEITALRTEMAQLEHRATVRTVTIVAIANGILFAALRYLPPAA